MDGLETGGLVLAGVGRRAEMVWEQAAPAVDLVHDLDKEALPGGQQAEYAEVEAGDLAQAALRVGEQAQDAVRQNENGWSLVLLAGRPERTILSLESRPER